MNGNTFELTDDELDLLGRYLGRQFVDDLRDPSTRSAAVAHLVLTLKELTDYEYGLKLWCIQTFFGPEATEVVANALEAAAGDDCVRSVIAELRGWSMRRALSEPRAPAHIGRADNGGCICGWDGIDLLHHFREVRAGHELARLSVDGTLADQAQLYLLRLLTDPRWAAAYQDARDNPAMVAQTDFPSAVVSSDTKHPPGALLARWALRRGYTDDIASDAVGLPVDRYRGIVAGSDVITAGIAAQLEKTGLSRNTWLMLERNYRAALVEQAQGDRN
jgi:plasmid maintenance system antidote protein VapI